jgi:hypothetical protein
MADPPPRFFRSIEGKKGCKYNAWIMYCSWVLHTCVRHLTGLQCTCPSLPGECEQKRHGWMNRQWGNNEACWQCYQEKKFLIVGGVTAQLFWNIALWIGIWEPIVYFAHWSTSVLGSVQDRPPKIFFWHEFILQSSHHLRILCQNS